jgi:uncharacterized membrane protein
VWLLVVAAIHGFAVWALPRVIMYGAMSRLVPASGTVKNEHVRVVYPPLTTAAARSIVLPSPDLAYAMCVYDLSKGPVDVDAALDWPGYWSVALYADNTDNFYVLNDHQANGKPTTIMIIGKGQTLPPQPEGTIVISAPTDHGLVLFRTLINDDARLAEIDGQRRASKCEQLLPSDMK